MKVSGSLTLTGGGGERCKGRGGEGGGVHI